MNVRHIFLMMLINVKVVLQPRNNRWLQKPIRTRVFSAREVSFYMYIYSIIEFHCNII